MLCFFLPGCCRSQLYAASMVVFFLTERSKHSCWLLQYSLSLIGTGGLWKFKKRTRKVRTSIQGIIYHWHFNKLTWHERLGPMLSSLQKRWSWYFLRPFFLVMVARFCSLPLERDTRQYQIDQSIWHVVQSAIGTTIRRRIERNAHRENLHCSVSWGQRKRKTVRLWHGLQVEDQPDIPRHTGLLLHTLLGHFRMVTSAGNMSATGWREVSFVKAAVLS